MSYCMGSQRAEKQLLSHLASTRANDSPPNCSGFTDAYLTLVIAIHHNSLPFPQSMSRPLALSDPRSLVPLSSPITISLSHPQRVPFRASASLHCDNPKACPLSSQSCSSPCAKAGLFFSILDLRSRLPIVHWAAGEVPFWRILCPKPRRIPFFVLCRFLSLCRASSCCLCTASMA